MFVFLILMTILCGIGGDLVDEDQNPYIRALRKIPLAQQFAHGYIEVRPGAHLFYWLYYADGTTVKASHKPLVIWIQGGPGFAASGIGLFAEFGPLNMEFEPRNHTWVKGRNVLIIDHPVGTGFSYATNNSLLVKSDREMAIDLSRAIKSFYKRFKQFRKTPTYVIGQSYGGKICPRLGFYLYTGPTLPVFITENLTPNMKRLFYLARDFAKTYEYRYCWVSNGKIYLRERVGSSLVFVNDESDLRKLRETK